MAYEYFLIGEIAIYKQEQIDQENDRIEEEKIQVDQDWADEMEAEDLAREEAAEKAKAEKEAKEKVEKAYDPLKDPEQIKWMKEEIEKNKTVFGDDFGEDVGIEFEDED